MHRYRFLLSPRWILFSLLCVLLMATTVNLGLWQWHRHTTKRDARELAAERAEQAPLLLDEAVSPDDDAGAADDLRFTPVSVTGTYDTAAEVLVRSRTFDGRTGYWVLTPLVPDGSDAAVVVNRGWIPLDIPAERPVAGVAPPSGEVTVQGVLVAGQTRGAFGPRDPADGTLTELARADLGRIQQQYPADLYPVIVLLDAQEPAQAGDLPVPVPPAPPDLGPHLGYTLQWGVFTLLVPVGWFVVVRQSARRRERDERRAAREAGAGAVEVSP